MPNPNTMAMNDEAAGMSDQSNVDIANLLCYIDYMAELAKWQAGLRSKPKYVRIK